ncbi:MAG TPA: GNAT family N-acetyltransferase [Actinocrinis sp.]
MRASDRPPAEPITADRLRIVRANQASWDDLQAVFGDTDYPSRCFCHRYKTGLPDYNPIPLPVRKDMTRDAARCGEPEAETTIGLVAYLEDEPVGWVSVEPRTAFRFMRRTPWAGRNEDRTDDSVWAVMCFVTRKGYRRRGITYALASAAVDFAREEGARALEGYPMAVPPGKEITWGELHVGARQVFDDAGFKEVCQPSPRRVVMRIDFAD